MSEPALILGALAAGAAFKLGALSWVGKTRKSGFLHVGTVSALNIYPVKSCRSIAVPRAECTDIGLCHDGVTDRHWLIVDSNGVFHSQRKEPSMALIKTGQVGNEIELSAPGMTSFRLPLKDKTNAGSKTRCRVWNDYMDAVDCGDKAAAWVSKYLKREGCRILRYETGVTKRGIWKQSWETYSKPEDKVSFGDFCSYFLLTENSLDDLNSRLPRPVTMRRFRPNIVVSGPPAYAEDSWMEVRIGDKAVLRYVDACSRCTLTTVDPERGVKDPNEEPLKTLRSFRLKPAYGNAPLFGSYFTLEVNGNIQVGDPVYALPWPQS